MRLLAYVGIGVFVVTMGYGLIGWAVYDFEAPCYVAEPGDRVIDEFEFEGTRTWTRVVTWRFTGYELRPVTNSSMDGLTSWVNTRFGWCFSPYASIVRRCQGLAYRGEEHNDESSDSEFPRCSRSRRWEALEP